MKYVIMCGGYYEQWETPKQLQTINGVPIVTRTINLLKNNGINEKNIFITSNDSRFDGLGTEGGVKRLEHENSYRYEGGQLKGYWLDAFYPNFNTRTKVTFLYGDVYYSDAAIKKIIAAPSSGNILFGSAAAKVKEKEWGEPYAFVVNDLKTFYAGIAAVKKLQDDGKTKRVPITWELYRYLNGIDVNTHEVKDDTYIVINDETNDVDTPAKLEKMKAALEVWANVFTFGEINAIGGGESFLYYLAEQYRDRDITIIYEKGDARQIERLKKYVRVIKFNGQKFKCKKAFFTYDRCFIDNIEAEERYQIIHTGYYENNLTVRDIPRLKYIAVSKAAAESFKKQTGLDCEVCYNPLQLGEEKPLVLMSATRLKKGNKGKERIVKLSNALQAAGVNFIWFIFTEDTNKIKDDNIVYIPPRLDAVYFLQRADWFVQLSDEGEAYCYSVAEARLLGVPLIVTPCKAFIEQGVNDKNAVIINFDVSDVPIDKITRGLTVPKFAPLPDNYANILAPGKSTYKPPEDTGEVLVEAIRTFDDIITGYRHDIGEQFKVTKERAAQLIRAGVIKRL